MKFVFFPQAVVTRSGNGQVFEQLVVLSFLCQLHQEGLNLRIVTLANRKSGIIALCFLPQKENGELSHPIIVCMNNGFC